MVSAWEIGPCRCATMLIPEQDYGLRLNAHGVTSAPSSPAPATCPWPLPREASQEKSIELGCGSGLIAPVNWADPSSLDARLGR